MAFLLVIIAIVGYILGGLNGAIITSRFVFHDDVRNHGSGNAGLTNFNRTYGVKGILLVLAIDVVKTLISVLIGGWLLSSADAKTVGQVFGGFCAILGHAAPIMYGFKGGKGVLCAGTMILVVDPVAGICCWGVFILVAICTRYISLSSCIACLMGAVFLVIFGHGGLEVLLTLLCGLLVVIKHAENILRIINGSESRFTFNKAQ